MNIEELKQIMSRYGLEFVKYVKLHSTYHLYFKMEGGVIVWITFKKPIEKLDRLIVLYHVLGREKFKQYLEEAKVKCLTEFV
jgi:hypothetical protein